MFSVRIAIGTAFSTVLHFTHMDDHFARPAAIGFHRRSSAKISGKFRLRPS
jgi:hypothetical protein